MNPFDPLPHAPLAMPKQQLEDTVSLKQKLARFAALFLRQDAPPLRREN